MATGAISLEKLPSLRVDRRTIGWLLLGAAILLVLIHHFVYDLTQFPQRLNLGLRQPMDDFQRWTVLNRRSHPIFLYFFQPLTAALDYLIRRAEDFLLWLPWPVAAAAVFLLGQKIAGLRVALLTTACLLLMGLVGLWEESMVTLALMLISVIISLLIGIPLGVWAARNVRVERALRPFLDAMQTMPAFVYLIPVVLFFGVARVPSLVATVVYALPPAIRLTSLGIRSVPDEAIEAARAFGTTDRQLLYKVQIPLAMPTIMAGVNQTIMMALGIVVIAAFIGAGGLGDVVLKSLRRLNVGRAFEAGLAIVFMAILLDRISYGLSQIEHTSQAKRHAFRLLPPRWGERAWARRFEGGLDRIFAFSGRWNKAVADRAAAVLPVGGETVQRQREWAAILLLLLALSAVCRLVGEPLLTFPARWLIDIGSPINTAVQWAQINLYKFAEIGGVPLGTGPLRDFITLYLLNPLVDLLQNGVGWPAMILLVAAVAYAVAGWRLALGTAVGMVFMGALGMWSEAMETLGQVVLAVLISVVLGVPLGIWSARSDTVEALMRPILDFLQTIPPFVYLVPVIMLFSVGSMPGIIAAVLYAIPPVIRLTSLGIRTVDRAAVEAADSFGSTGWQTLRKVQLPLALPTIMAGINQTVMMVLSMVIIAGLIGGAGLGFEVVSGFAQNEMGRGVEAGLAIVVMAVILDRITQAWAQRQAEVANLTT